MKIRFAAAETLITFRYITSRKSQKHIPKKIARTKIIRAAPAEVRGRHFELPPSFSAGAPPTPAKVKIPLEKGVVLGGSEDPPSGGEEWSVPFPFPFLPSTPPRLLRAGGKHGHEENIFGPQSPIVLLLVLLRHVPHRVENFSLFFLSSGSHFFPLLSFSP